MINITLDGSESWLDALKPYQRRPIEKFIAEDGDDKAVDKWLTSSGFSQTSPFGGMPAGGSTNTAFSSQLRKEFKGFICGEEKYAKQREEIENMIAEHKGSLVTVITTVISAALAATLGASAALIAPAVVLMLRIMSKVGVEAWCALPSKD